MRGNKREDAEQHVLENPEREVCGFVYHDRYVRLTNTSPNPNSFIAEPAEIAKCLAHYGEPESIFHSHPNGTPRPSSKDLELASYYKNSIILIGTIVDGKLEIFQV